MARIKFMNTQIDNLTMEEALQAIDSLIKENKSAYVVTPNVDHIVRLETNKELQAVYAGASLILADGKPLPVDRKMVWDSDKGKDFRLRFVSSAVQDVGRKRIQDVFPGSCRGGCGKGGRKPDRAVPGAAGSRYLFSAIWF